MLSVHHEPTAYANPKMVVRDIRKFSYRPFRMMSPHARRHFNHDSVLAIVTSRIKQPDVKINAVRCGLPTVAGFSSLRPCSLNLWWLSLMRIVDQRQKSL